MSAYQARGWEKIAHDPSIEKWAHSAASYACAALAAPDHADQWQCEGTWFVGVDVLPNDRTGAIGGVPFSGRAVDRVTALHGLQIWHSAQVSVVRPGYPRPRAGESAAGFRYRQRRDAAHVDGLLAIGPERRRFVKEPHAFVLGLPLNETSPDAAPLVVWEGSHLVMRDVFADALGQLSDPAARDMDVTDLYQTARRKVFETCPRRELFARPGEALLLHRHVLHGIAAFPDAAFAPSEGRMVAYFRPQIRDLRLWATAP